MKKLSVALMLLLLGLLLATAASADAPDGFYMPSDLKDQDWESPFSQWCYKRSRSSEHFIVFWERGFGEDPARSSKPVDVDKLLRRAEESWDVNVDRLGMVTVGEGVSRLDTYKLQVYLMYTDEWIAVSSHYDNIIGMLWISPMAANMDGCSFAHEIGHCFQFQIYCDNLLMGAKDDGSTNFRYNYPGAVTNYFWEQCAQWVSYIKYPNEAASEDEFGDFGIRSNLAFEHEWTRYESYWFLIYLAQHYGENLIARIWQESVYPEHSLAVLTRLQYGGDVTRLNDDLYDYAASMATGELLPEGIESLAERFTTAIYMTEDGWRQVGYASCPGVGGFNIIALPLTTSSITFEGLEPGSALAPGDPGQYRAGEDGGLAGTVTRYNTTNVRPGWRWGLVVVNKDGTAQKLPMQTSASGTLSVQLPAGTTHLYLVVLGAPKELCVSPVDFDERTDLQFPYRFKLTAK